MGTISVVFVAVCTCIFLTNQSSQTENKRGTDGHFPFNSNEDNGIINRVVRSAQPSLIFNTRDIVVNEGEPLNLKCGVDGEYNFCLWKHGIDDYRVKDVNDGVYPGFRAPDDKQDNQCGIVVDPVKTEHHGEWSCKVLLTGRTPLIDSKNVVVTIQPKKTDIEIQPSPLIANITENTTVVCSVAAARPAAGMKWYLGDEDITDMSASDKSPIDNKDTYKSISTLTRRFLPRDDEKTLTCSITHVTLPYGANSSVPVSVLFKPIEKKTTHYQIPPGNNYVVNFTFSSNPKPFNVTWKFGDLEVSLIIPGSQGRYFTCLHDLGNNKYNAKLFIGQFTPDDSKKNYSLLVHNDLGETEYQIRLDEPQPATDPGPVSQSSLWFAGLGGAATMALVWCICACSEKLKKKIRSLSARVSA